MNDIEKDTVWKINDCQELLRNRVSEKFVNDAIKGLDQQFTREVIFDLLIIAAELNIRYKSRAP